MKVRVTIAGFFFQLKGEIPKEYVLISLANSSPKICKNITRISITKKKSFFQSTSLYSEPLSACLTSDASSGPELILTLSSCTFRTTQTWFCTVDNVSSYSEMKLPLEIYEYSNHSSSHPSSFYRCFLKTIRERQIESSIPSQDKTRGDKVNRRARSSRFWLDIHLALVDLCHCLPNNRKRCYYFYRTFKVNIPQQQSPPPHW